MLIERGARAPRSMTGGLAMYRWLIVITTILVLASPRRQLKITANPGDTPCPNCVIVPPPPDGNEVDPVDGIERTY
jgi:hypothetical protein